MTGAGAPLMQASRCIRTISAIRTRVSTVALAIGLLVGDVVKPGQGFNIDASTLDPNAVAGYVTRAKEDGVVAHPDAAEEIADPARRLTHGQEQVLGGEVVVAQRGALGVGGLERGIGAGGELRLLGGLAVDLGDA